MAIVGGKVTLTLRRPLPVRTWHLPGADYARTVRRVMPGETVTIPLSPGFEQPNFDPWHPENREWFDRRSALLCAAKTPCKQLDTDSDGDDYNTWSWFTCARFPEMCSNVIFVCRGDKCRCPSSKVRAEAAVAIGRHTTMEPTQGRD